MGRVRFIDLDDPAWDDLTMVVQHRGQRVTLSRGRVMDLLRHEDQLLDMLSAAQTESAEEDPAPVEPPPRRISLSISHASLSNRIKRVYGYTSGTRRLRAAQAQILVEALAQFDWQIPPHPNTQLDQHLAEILGWKGVDPESRLAIETFLVRYVAARSPKR